MPLGQRIAAALALTALLLFAPSAAHAASNDVIRDLQIEIDIRPTGELDVTETYQWDFGSREGLGFSRLLSSRVGYEPDPDKVRVYRYDDFEVSSPSGAPAGVWTRPDGAHTRVDVGAPDGSEDRRSGVQTYVLRYTVEGALNAIRDQEGVSDQEELYWNATGLGWDIPIESTSVTVTGPAEVVDHACYQGPRGSDASCDTLETSWSQVTASHGRLDSNEGLTIMAAYPVGTFGPIEPILVDAPPDTPGTVLSEAADGVADFLRGNAAWLLPIGVAAPVAYGLRRRLKGRDSHFIGLPPGVFPAGGAPVQTGPLKDEPTVAVRFTPPDGLRPAEVGALSEKQVSAEHISATIIDLAARGYLRLEETQPAGTFRRADWEFVATPGQAPREELRDYEQLLLAHIFLGLPRVRLSSLRNTFASTMTRARRLLAAGLDTRQLFAKPLPTGGVGCAKPLLFIAVVWTFLFFNFARAVMATPVGSIFLVASVLTALLVALGIARSLTAKASRERTAAGRAFYEQARGFELYLSTAEGHQLRFEEGEDIFSRYLPYAMVFGVAERWAGIFERLRQQGVRVAEPSWYVGSHGFDSNSFGNMSSAISSFSSTASKTLSSTPGSSGGSGSSGGGGGSSGGGGGGGGGGGR